MLLSEFCATYDADLSHAAHDVCSDPGKASINGEMPEAPHIVPVDARVKDDFQYQTRRGASRLLGNAGVRAASVSQVKKARPSSPGFEIACTVGRYRSCLPKS